MYKGLAPAIKKISPDLYFLGLIDLQDTIIGRKARNTGHKALRARAVADLADVIGWEHATGVYYMGVPDMAIGPLYYSLYDAACVTMTNDFPDAGKQLKDTNVAPLTPAEVDVDRRSRLNPISAQRSLFSRYDARPEDVLL